MALKCAHCRSTEVQVEAQSVLCVVCGEHTPYDLAANPNPVVEAPAKKGKK